MLEVQGNMQEPTVPEFNNICRDIAGYKACIGEPPPRIWAEYIMSVLTRPQLNALAMETGAASLLTVTFNIFRAEDNAAMEEPRSFYTYEQYFGLSLAVSSFFDPKEVADVVELEKRFTDFKEAAIKVLEKAPSPPEAEEGAVTSVAIPATADKNWPSVSLLWTQTDGLAPLVQRMGRQTGEQGWSEWFKAKFDKIIESTPSLAGMATWAALGKYINWLLGGVGLIPIMGSNIVTFGSSLLTPVKALTKFPTFMVTQGLLYDLHNYGSQKMRLPKEAPVMKAIRNAIDSIDWAAMQMAFRVTPFALAITIYSVGKWVHNWVRPEANKYLKEARVLLQAADRIDGTEQQKQESQLARMAVMALSGDYEDYLKIMTERVEDAEKDLSSKMDA